MKIQLLFPWQQFGKGAIVDVNGVLGEAMIRNRQADPPRPTQEPKKRGKA